VVGAFSTGSYQVTDTRPVTCNQAEATRLADESGRGQHRRSAGESDQPGDPPHHPHCMPSTSLHGTRVLAPAQGLERPTDESQCRVKSDAAVVSSAGQACSCPGFPGCPRGARPWRFPAGLRSGPGCGV